MTKEEFISKARQKHGNLYDYSKLDYTGSKNKVCIIDPIFGEFFQTAADHLRGRGHKERKMLECCQQRKLTTEQFISRATKLHGYKYDYSKSQYIGYSKKILIIDRETNFEFWQTAGYHIAPKSKKRSTKIKQNYTSSRPRILNLEIFLERAIARHGYFYDYSKVVYEKANKKVIVVDPDYGEWLVTPNDHWRGVNHPARSRKISRTSLSWLLSLPGARKFITPFTESAIRINNRNRYVDGFDHTNNTVYQFHGSFYHGFNGEKITDQKKYEISLLRDQQIRNAGYNLVVMWEHDWKPTREDWGRVPHFQSNTDIFIEKARNIHGDKWDYSETKYINSKTRISFKDKVTGQIFYQKPLAHLKWNGRVDGRIRNVNKSRSSQLQELTSL